MLSAISRTKRIGLSALLGTVVGTHVVKIVVLPLVVFYPFAFIGRGSTILTGERTLIHYIVRSIGRHDAVSWLRHTVYSTVTSTTFVNH